MMPGGINPLQRAIFEAMTKGQQGSEYLPPEVLAKMKAYLQGAPMPNAAVGMQGQGWGQVASDPDY
jgi:hypothetical protein